MTLECPSCRNGGALDDLNLPADEGVQLTDE